MDEEDIIAAFETKKDTLLDLQDAQDVLEAAKRTKAKKLLEIAKHDKLMRDQNTMDKLIIKGKNQDERDQCERLVLEKENDHINDAEDVVRIKKLEDEFSDLAIKEIDFRMRNAGM